MEILVGTAAIAFGRMILTYDILVIVIDVYLLVVVEVFLVVGRRRIYSTA